MPEEKAKAAAACSSLAGVETLECLEQLHMTMTTDCDGDLAFITVDLLSASHAPVITGVPCIFNSPEARKTAEHQAPSHPLLRCC